MRCLGRVAVAIARCDAEALDAALAECAEEPAAASDVVDAILQGIPYSGFPGAIDALGRWSTLDGSVPAAQWGSEAEGSAADVGVANFSEVYGEVADRVRAELERFHPELERWIIEFAYGRVMGRSPLTLADKEALGVASLLGQGRRRPLRSHVRGALRTGWEPQALLAYLEDLHPGRVEWSGLTGKEYLLIRGAWNGPVTIQASI
ncbi:MAG: hypothetical protein AAF488_07335 [Planctomycetota bacterium]